MLDQYVTITDLARGRAKPPQQPRHPPSPTLRQQIGKGGDNRGGAAGGHTQLMNTPRSIRVVQSVNRGRALQ